MVAFFTIFTIHIYNKKKNLRLLSKSSEQIAEHDPFRFGSNFAHVFIGPKWEICKAVDKRLTIAHPNRFYLKVVVACAHLQKMIFDSRVLPWLIILLRSRLYLTVDDRGEVGVRRCVDAFSGTISVISILYFCLFYIFGLGSVQ